VSFYRDVVVIEKVPLLGGSYPQIDSGEVDGVLWRGKGNSGLNPELAGLETSLERMTPLSLALLPDEWPT